MPDRDKYIEVLSKAAKTVKEFNEDTPINISLECIEDILELLKEQDCNCCGTVFDVAYKAGKADAIVRCKDCVNRHDSINCRMYSEGMDTPDSWFCADAERRTDE